MGFLKKKPLFLVFEKGGEGKEKRRMIVSGYVFWDDFLAFLLLLLMFVLFLWRGN